MIESSTTSTATTLTIGSWLGRKRLSKIQIGSVSWPAPIVNVVTMISSNDSAKASSPPATSAVRMFGRVTRRNVCHGSAPRSADASSIEPEHAAQPGDDVVVDDDDAEGGVADDHREQAEVDPEHLGERVAERDAGDDPGQRDRQDDQERDRLAAEEAVARDRQRGQRAEHQRDRRSPPAPTFSEVDERVAGVGVREAPS